MINLNRVRGYKKSTLGLVLLSFCLVLTNPSKGQWSQVTLDSSLQYFGLNALHFLNEDTGHVVGLNEFFYTGLYMKTTDGGATWSVNAPKYQGEFNDVQFTSVDTGYIVGDNSLLLKSVDGGVNWIEDTTATSGIADINFNDIEFINSQVGYMVGDMGLVLKTTNGGANWNLLRMDTSNKGHHLQKVEFLNEQVGYVAGSIDPEVILLKTINGGATWDTVFQQNEYGVLDFQILNDSVSYFCTYSSLYQTQDNWATFSLVAIDPGAVQVNPQAFYFLDELNGYIFATRDSPKSYVYKTHDGGNSWYRQDVDTLDMFVDFQMVNNSVGYAVGYSGTLVKTINSGGGGCPQADFKVSSDHSCDGPEFSFYFTDMSTDSIYPDSTIEYNWDFGDGGSNMNADALHSYYFDLDSSSTPIGYIDTFIVTLTVTNAVGCQASHKDTVIISNDCVWPGNTDDDPIPNYKDLLPIGLGYGISGIVRVDQATNWDGKLALNWSDTLANGKNLKHADCNGDGIIDKNDIPSIITNYGIGSGKTSKQSSYNAANPDLYFELSKDTISPGDTVVAKIKLGRSGLQAQNIYGIAFRISFNASFVDSSSLSIDFDNSWLGKRDSDMVVIARNDYTNSFIDVALTRIDHMPKDGDGELGALTFVTIDNLSGGIFELDFDETILIDTAATLVPHNTLSDSLAIVGINNVVPIGKNVEVYPNPATDNIHIDAGNLKVQEVKLYDILGSLVLKQEVTKLQNIDINTSNIPEGVYILTLETTKGTVTRRVDIVK